MEMRVDERIVVMIPKTTQRLNSKAHKIWIRRAVARSLWDLRNRILKETNEDIFGLFTMTDCIEINIRGTLETLHVEPVKKRPAPKKRRRR